MFTYRRLDVSSLSNAHSRLILFRFVQIRSEQTKQRYDSQVPTVCNYPGCTRPLAKSTGPGRPSEYCELPDHTRWRAWRERQRLQQEAETPTENVTVTLKGPVATARLRADELLTQFRTLADQLGTTLTAAVAEMNTLADPGAAEAQVQAVQADAARRIAEAEIAAAAAEQSRRDAYDARLRAEEAAEDAARAAEDAEDRIAGADTRTAAAVRDRDDALREVEKVAARAADDIFAARSAAEDEIRAARAESEQQQQHLREQCDQEITRAQRAAHTEIERLRRECAQRETAAAAERDLAVQRAADIERALERAEQSAAERAQTAQEMRAELQRLRADTDMLRAELAELRRSAAAELAAARTEAEDRLEKARAEAAQRTEALEHAGTQTLARAERAERQLDDLLAERGTRLSSAPVSAADAV